MVYVGFKRGTKAKYDALKSKDPDTLYWLYDVQRLYKGDVLYAIGTEATNLMAGLMSAEDKAKLDALSASEMGTPVFTTLRADGWVSGMQTLLVDGVDSNTNGVAGVSQAITNEQMEAASAAELHVCAQTDGAVTIAARGDTPCCDIPIVILLMGGSLEDGKNE